MKKITLTLALLLVALFVKSTDLIVEEFGVPPTYSSITSAINAAADGDRILIKPRFDPNLPWVEDLYLDKSVTLLSFIADTTFLLDGSVFIVPTAGKEVTIIGLQSYGTDDNIEYVAGPAPMRTMKVNIFASITNDIDLRHESLLTQISGNITENVSVDFGDVIGNDIKILRYDNRLTSLATYLNDTCYIIGNKLNNIFFHGGGEHVFIKNNDAPSNSSIRITELNQTHQISNNIFWKCDINSLEYPSILITGNNFVYKFGAPFIENDSLPNVDVYFNGGVCTDTMFSNVRNSLYNQTDSLIDAGNPSPMFTDTDLTRNDIGIEGGPTPYSNFHPVRAGKARVYLVVHPFYIRQGNSIKVTAFGYDK